jgi:hypothetical protein
MDWRDLGGSLIKAGAPIIGTALGGPLGGMIGGAIGGVVADALGVPATPEAVDTALKTTPAPELQAKLSAAEIEAQAKWPALAEIAKAEADVAKVGLEQVNESIRAEAARVNGWWGNWRTVLAWTLAIETFAWPPFIMWLIAAKGGVGDLVQAAGIITTWWTARFGVLGVHVWTGSRERQTIVTGAPAPTVVGQVIKAVRGK